MTMPTPHQHNSELEIASPTSPRPAALNRRSFLGAAAASSVALALGTQSAAAVARLKKPVRLGVIADLHHDIMHDGLHRLETFIQQVAPDKLDGLLQLGDFAYPYVKNKDVIDKFNDAHKRTLHVIGNHDTDAGHTKQQCLDVWGMPSRYYTETIEGLHLIVLDGNDKGSPTHKGGYASYIGPEQVKWLKQQLATLDGPIIVTCHQPLAGSGAIDNAEELQTVLGESADKVVLAINGHSHIDSLLRMQGVPHMHVNSASYQWVGGKHKHLSYDKQVHDAHPWISHTCPYRDSLFATFTIDLESLTIQVEGRTSEWVGQSPAQLGAAIDPALNHGEEIAPTIQNRHIERVASQA